MGFLFLRFMGIGIGAKSVIFENDLGLINKISRRWLHILLLLFWVVIGTGLRFTLLEDKPPWSDEFATLVFSLGNSFRIVPLDQVISIDTLFQPLLQNSGIAINSVVHNLTTESNHPPVYFVLNHLWLKLFPSSNGLVSLGAARALTALLGVATIPAIFALGLFAFKSFFIAQFSAALMAVSPYGIYLAQETRHYTLTILWVIASLGCLIRAVRCVKNQTHLPFWVALSWVVVNALGIASHYFFALAVVAEGLVILRFWLSDFFRKTSRQFSIPFSQCWLKIYAVALGTLISGLVWLPVLRNVSDSSLTGWVQRESLFGNLFAPASRIFVTLITMFCMLPVEEQSLPIQIGAGLGMLVFIVWLIFLLIRGIKEQLTEPIFSLSWQVLGGFVLSAIAVILGVSYAMGADLTLAARYQFFYFPGVILLVAGALKPFWDLGKVNQNKVAIIWLVGFLGGMIVALHLAYLKPDRPDLVAEDMIKNYQETKVPVLIANVHKTHEQTGEIMGIVWELKRRAGTSSLLESTKVILVDKNEAQTPTQILDQTLSKMQRPLDLWTVNFSAAVEAEKQNCKSEEKSRNVAGYKYRLYHCR